MEDLYLIIGEKYEIGGAKDHVVVVTGHELAKDVGKYYKTKSIPSRNGKKGLDRIRVAPDVFKLEKISEADLESIKESEKIRKEKEDTEKRKAKWEELNKEFGNK